MLPFPLKESNKTSDKALMTSSSFMKSIPWTRIQSDNILCMYETNLWGS